MKKCVICGREFEPTANAQRICENPHFASCPVCGRKMLWSSTKPVPPCSAKCSNKKREQTTMERYSVNNVGQSKQVQLAKKQNWRDKVHELLPLKYVQRDTKMARTPINESEMDIYFIRESSSKEFLKQYGFRMKPKWRKKKLSLGLVSGGVLYQLVRFEIIKGEIVLVDFGTKTGYFNPNGYTSLISYATNQVGIDEFTAIIPRHLATSDLIENNNLILAEEGDYEVYWITPQGDLDPLDRWDNIEEMKQEMDYVTSDYLDKYTYTHQ